jgi:hypothetical protein
MSSPAGTYNILADQGATFTRVITWTNSAGSPVNLTGYTARMSLRTTYTDTTVALSLTTENGRITLGGALGTITLNVDAATMATLAAKSYVYDLELVNGVNVTRLLQGSFANSPEVTR